MGLFDVGSLFKPTAGKPELMIRLITEGKSAGFQQHRSRLLNTFVKLLKKSMQHPVLLLCSRNQGHQAGQPSTNRTWKGTGLSPQQEAKLCTDSSLCMSMLIQHIFLHDKQVGSGQRQNCTGPFPQGKTCFSARLQHKTNHLKKGFQCLLVLDIQIKFTQVAEVCINDK